MFLQGLSASDKIKILRISVRNNRRKKCVDTVDIKIAVICRLSNLIKQKDITLNVVAVRLVVSPSTIKNILYSLSKNAALFYEKKARIKEKPLWVNPVAIFYALNSVLKYETVVDMQCHLVKFK